MLTQEQRVALLEAYFAVTSYKRCVELFHEKFPDVPIPGKTTVYDIVKRFRETGSVNERSRSRQPDVLTPEFTERVQQSLLRSPGKSLRRLSQQLGASYSTCHRATKRLRLRPYRVRVVQELRPLDSEKRVAYCQWFKRFTLNDVNNKLNNTFFSDEAWFHLNGYVNSQNTRIWAANNPHTLHETQLHPQKIGVWCAMSRQRIVGPIFFNTTVTSVVYADIIQQFIAMLEVNERYCWFQQDGATCHTSNDTMTMLREFFDDRLISNNLWPPRSPDLTSPDFFLWGHLKEKVYCNNPRTLEDLKNNITAAVREVTVDVLRRVSENMCRRVDMCLLQNGGQFQHLL